MDTQFAQHPRNDYRENAVLPHAEADSAVSWCAIFAGAVASAALSLILLFLGTGFGFTLISPWSGEGISGTTFTVSSIIGITVISLLASAIGGYLAGRLRTRWVNTPVDEVYFRDTAHGFLSWSVATLGTAALLSTVTGAIVSGGVKAGAAIVEGSSSMVSSAASSMSAPSGDSRVPGSSNAPLPYLLDSLLRTDTNAPVANTPQVSADPENPTAETMPATTETTRAMPNRAPAQHSQVTRELGRIYVNGISTGALPDDDVRYAGQLIAQHTDVDQSTAEKRVTETFAKLQTTLNEAEKTAKEAAEKAREVTAYTSLWLFISLLIGAFIASLMAVYGGRQRDL
jgi:hypothetical protein